MRNKKKNLCTGLNCLKVTELLQADSLFFIISPQDVVVLIWSTSEGWKAESTLEPPCGFDPGTSGLEI